MSKSVGVDPANLQELTRRLQRLHTLLAEHGSAVHQKMRKWDSELNYSALPRLIDEALNDARDMNARTTEAYRLARENGWSPRRHGRRGNLYPFDRTSPPTVDLDWATTGESGHQGRQDATALAETLKERLNQPPHQPPHELPHEAAAYGGPDQVGAGRSALPVNIASHLHDTAYLTAFWANACPLALQAARALSNRAGATLFSAESASILRALGASLAAASQMHLGTGEDRRPLLSGAARAAIIKHSDPWSVGMLVKYGPDGKTWDSHFLADLTRSLLDARAAGRIEVPYPAPGTAPGETDRHDLRRVRLQAEFDPVIAVLDRASQNGQAARHVLGDPSSGLSYARMLVDDQWRRRGGGTDPSAEPAHGHVPESAGPLDLSAHPADFLTAATSAGRGVTQDAHESAWSVVTIVRATSAFGALHPETPLPAGIRHALVHIADRYLPDFAASADHGGEDGVRLRGDDPDGRYVCRLLRSDLHVFFAQALHDPAEFARFHGSLDARADTQAPRTSADGGQVGSAELTAIRGLLAELHG